MTGLVSPSSGNSPASHVSVDGVSRERAITYPAVAGFCFPQSWWVPRAIQDVWAPALLCLLLGPDAMLQHQPDLPSYRVLGQGAAAARLSECTSGTRVSSQFQVQLAEVPYPAFRS